MAQVCLERVPGYPDGLILGAVIYVADVNLNVRRSLRIAGEGKKSNGYQHQWQKAFHYFSPIQTNSRHKYYPAKFDRQTLRIPMPLFVSVFHNIEATLELSFYR
jgi:hypothetical protein